MQKSKILALAISAISTGILISCAKPAETTDGTDKEKLKAEPKNKSDESATTSVVNTENDNNKTAMPVTKKAPSIQSIDLPMDETTAYLRYVSNSIIIPLYKNAAEQSQSLNKTSIEMCKSGSLSIEQIKELRLKWLSVAKAWAKTEIVNYGPAYENMANLYINYFPDERGLVNKSIKRLITDNPQLKPEQFADESAIVQGVPALEDILYTNDNLDEAQCNYLISATSELNNRLTNISELWEKDSHSLLDSTHPVTGMNQFFNGLLFHIENLKSTGIDKPLALNSKKKGHVPAHISGQSRAIVKAKLDILKQAFTDKELAMLIGDNTDGKKIIEQMTATITVTESQLSSLPEDINNASKTEQNQLHENLTTLTKQIKRGIMPLLGVQLGFNSTDGD